MNWSSQRVVDLFHSLTSRVVTVEVLPWSILIQISIKAQLSIPSPGACGLTVCALERVRSRKILGSDSLGPGASWILGKSPLSVPWKVSALEQTEE